MSERVKRRDGPVWSYKPFHCVSPIERRRGTCFNLSDNSSCSNRRDLTTQKELTFAVRGLDWICLCLCARDKVVMRDARGPGRYSLNLCKGFLL